MKKAVCVVLGAVVLAGAIPLAGCAKRETNDTYEISAEYFPETRKLSAQMTFTYFNDTDNAHSELRFQLYPNAYREGASHAPVSELYRPSAYYAGESYGGIEISSVEGAAAWEVCGEDENILSVTLADPVYPDAAVSLSMTFEVTLALVNHRLGVGENAVNLSYFYPVLCAYSDEGWKECVYAAAGDPFACECADYTVELTVPQELTAICGGDAVLAQESGKKTYTVISENVRDCVFFLGERFSVVKAYAGEVPVEYYYFDDDDPQTALSAAADSLAFFSETFGDYAYPSYKLVQTDLCYGGMEYSMIASVSSDLQSDAVVRATVHETAHQWWYAAVGNDQFRHAWMDEGLAEFSCALFFEAYPQYGLSRQELVASAEKAYRSYFSVVQQLHGEADTSMSRPLTDFSGEYEYWNIAYNKGMILFDRLRSSVGEKKFLAGLRGYYDSFCFRMASPEDMIACFSRAGTDTEGFFASFVDGACVI